MEPRPYASPRFGCSFCCRSIFCRAAVEIDLRWFALGGAATALTVLTRFEGWFLLFPLVGWTVVRFWHLRCDRWRLVGGWACSLAMLPIAFYAFGLLQPEGVRGNQLRLDPVKRPATGSCRGELKARRVAAIASGDPAALLPDRRATDAAVPLTAAEIRIRTPRTGAARPR